MDRLPESNEDDPVRSALRSGTLPDGGCGPPPAAAVGEVGAELGSAEKVTLGSLRGQGGQHYFGQRKLAVFSVIYQATK